MNLHDIAQQFTAAVMPRTFTRSKDNPYVIRQIGPFKVRRYVNHGEMQETSFPHAVYVDGTHPKAQQAQAFISKDNRAVRRARERGIHVSGI